MKTSLLALSLGLAGILSGPLTAHADFEVSGTVVIQARADFDAPLAPIGDWVEIGAYGHCWHPRGVATTWRPYCDGTWVWTDSGWYWQSSEPWAWACYHYGTWVYDSNYGWCWVPDTEWAPAWVDWRTSDDYIGWVPCGPPGYTFDPGYYVFVQSRSFCDRVRPTTVIINNVEIINRTTVINNISRENRAINGRSQTVIINQGPRVDLVEKAAGRNFAAKPIQQADRRTFNSIPKTVRQRTLATQPSHDQQANPLRQPAPPAENRNAQPDRNFNPPSQPEHNNPGPDRSVQNPPERNTPPPQNNGSSSSSHWWSYHPTPKKTEPQPQPPSQPQQPQRPEQPQHSEQPPQPRPEQPPQQHPEQQPQGHPQPQQPQQHPQPQQPQQHPQPQQPQQHSPQQPQPQRPQQPQQPQHQEQRPNNQPNGGNGGGGNDNPHDNGH